MEIRKQAITAVAFLAAAAALLRRFPPDRYDVYPKCPLWWLTGWKCPGCGSTHAVVALLSAHWAEAWRYNALAVMLLPVFAAIAAVEFYSALRWNRWQPVAIPKPLAAVGLTAIVVFGVLRNML